MLHLYNTVADSDYSGLIRINVGKIDTAGNFLYNGVVQLAQPTKGGKAMKVPNHMKAEYPILSAHLESGTIKLEGHAYIGLASDGVYVQLGSISQERDTETYLQSRSSPFDW